MPLLPGFMNGPEEAEGEMLGKGQFVYVVVKNLNC